MKEIKDIKVDVPEGESGDWKIERFTVSDKDISIHNIRCMFSPGMGNRIMKAGAYTKLMRNKTIVMSDAPAEIMDHSYFVYKAKGNVLINGLGLGWIVEALFQKKEVETITVIEKSQDVINLVAKHYENKCPKDKKLWIIQADALNYKPVKGKKFDAVWHDIWDYICSDNLEDMKKLHRKYGKRTNWQGSWCRELCEMGR